MADAINRGKPDPEEDDMPYIEAPRDVVEHYNKHNMKGFDGGPLYFIFNGVKVYEEGRRIESLKRNRQTIEDKIFGKSKVG